MNANLSTGISAPATATSSASQSTLLTVDTLIDRYMAAYAGRDESRAQRLQWWKERLGSRLVADLTDDDVFPALEALETLPGRYYAGIDAYGQRIWKAKTTPRTPATINRYAASLAAVCTWAIKKRIVPRTWEHPCRRIERRPEDNERVRFLTSDERNRLLEACKVSKWPKLYLLVLVALTTGARRGEMLGLRWRDIDFARQVAYVNTRTKNGDGKSLPLTDVVIAEMKKFPHANGAAHVFVSKLHPDQPYNFVTAWKHALKAAKIRNFRFHDCRHCCASWLAQDGASILEIADVLGHRQLSVTKRYSHLTVQTKSRLINRVLGDVR